MALDYGKMEFAVSFKPITAFPLDSRSYYESLAAAEAAAATAVEAGSDQGTVYFGQTFVVVENGVAQMLQVQPDGTLSEIGGKIEIDENQFVIDEETGKLNLFGFADAVAGAQPVIEEVEVEGEKVKRIKWVKPDTTTVDGLATAVANLETAQEALEKRVAANEAAIGDADSGLAKEINDVAADVALKANAADVYTKTEADTAHNTLTAEIDKKANSADVYTKSEVYTKGETDTAIATAVAGADHLKRKIVANKEAIQTYIDEHDDAEQYIFMVPTVYNYTSDSNRYDEYIVLSSGEGEEKTYVIEPVGSWAVDLADYVSETELTAYLQDYYTETEVQDILKAYATVATLSDTLKNYYTFEQIDALLAKVYTKDELNTLLASYYTKTEIDNKFANYDDKTAIANSYYNKSEVDTKFTEHETAADDKYVAQEEGKSLVSDSEIEKLATVQANAEENYIKSVDGHFTVNDSHELSLKAVDMSEVTGLSTALDSKVEKQYFTVTDEETGETTTVEGTLLSPTDANKLSALVIGENGSVEISGKVNASNVEELDEWIIKNRDSVKGLISTADEAKLDALVDLIRSVSDEFNITADKELQLASIAMSKVTGLEDALNAKASGSALLDLDTKVTNLESSLNNYVLKSVYDEKMSAIEADIGSLKYATTWRELSE